MLTNKVNVFANPQASDKNKLPKKNIKNDLLPTAIFISLRISIKDIDPDHFERDLISSFVERDE